MALRPDEPVHPDEVEGRNEDPGNDGKTERVGTALVPRTPNGVRLLANSRTSTARPIPGVHIGQSADAGVLPASAGGKPDDQLVL